MKTTERVFVYGTLMDEKTQRLLLGRNPKSTDDWLAGYTKEQNAVYGAFPSIFQCHANYVSHVSGQVLEITSKELKRLNVYEGEGYKKIKVTTVKNIPCWVYIRK